MELTVDIGSKKVKFAVNGNTPRRFQKMTGKNYFDVMGRLMGTVDSANSTADVAALEHEDMYQLLHIYAMTADSDVPTNLDEWLETFDTFPLVDLVEATTELTVSNMYYIEKKK